MCVLFVSFKNNARSSILEASRRLVESHAVTSNLPLYLPGFECFSFYLDQNVSLETFLFLQERVSNPQGFL